MWKVYKGFTALKARGKLRPLSGEEQEQYDSCAVIR